MIVVVERLRDAACKWCGDEQLADACQHGLAIGLGRHEPVSLECGPYQDRRLSDGRAMGQMFIMGFDGTEVTSQIRSLIEDHHLGAVLLTAKNLKCLLSIGFV